ncbi:hypothetical protein SLA2020_197070 [Shorea laevis]
MAAVADKKLSGYRIRNRSPIISHLLFADDSLVFCKANMEEVRHLQYILQLYGDTTGQRVNFAKSAVIFSTNTNRDLRASICSQLGLNHDSAVSKYLGLPTSWGKSKKASLKQVVEKVRIKLKQWKVALLSQAGREVLIKAVAMSIPTYTMSCFLFPSCTCKEINKLIRDFWWGQQHEERKLCWVSWQMMTQSKFYGGMGFKDLLCFNLAMLAKQAWRLMQNPQSLWVRVLKSLYFKDTSFLSARKGSHPSWAWTSILKGKEILHLGSRWNVGDGSEILIYEDAWVPTLPHFKVLSAPQAVSLYSHVCDLLDERGNWDVHKLGNCFTNAECREILKIPTAPRSDSFIWHFDKYGQFTVKSAYLLAYQHTHASNLMATHSPISPVEWKHLWKLKLPPKIKIFLWRAILNRLPTLDNLFTKGVVNNTLCHNCQLLDESIMHALLYCPHVEPIWFGSALGFIPGQLRMQNFVEWWRFLVVSQKQMGTHLLIEQWAIICWTIWKARNKHYFEHSNINPAQAINQAHGMFREYCLTLNRDLLTPPVCTTQRKQAISRWTSPPPGFIKINVDASYFSNSGRTALAMVGRDPNGQIVMGSTWFCLALSPLMAEATALLKAIQTADDLGLDHVIFESDNEALLTYA